LESAYCLLRCSCSLQKHTSILLRKFSSCIWLPTTARTRATPPARNGQRRATSSAVGGAVGTGPRRRPPRPPPAPLQPPPRRGHHHLVANSRSRIPWRIECGGVHTSIAPPPATAPPTATCRGAGEAGDDGDTVPATAPLARHLGRLLFSRSHLIPRAAPSRPARARARFRRAARPRVQAPCSDDETDHVARRRRARRSPSQNAGRPDRGRRSFSVVLADPVRRWALSRPEPGGT